MQVIGVLEALVAAGLAHRILIVAPSNLLANWHAVRRRAVARSPGARDPNLGCCCEAAAASVLTALVGRIPHRRSLASG